ncbi:synapsin-1-like [Mirounga leonina]|uniref:synapsin-1-like n=1 Tax=Mirounga leonina TaxID=9715 RepID=UPI00156BDC15|nr:synapsin-1-like [Mirounga leonina]
MDGAVPPERQGGLPLSCSRAPEPPSGGHGPLRSSPSAHGRLPKAHRALQHPIFPRTPPRPHPVPQRDRAAVQDRVASASRERTVCLQAGLSRSRGEELRPTRDPSGGDTSKGLLTGLPEKRQPGVQLAAGAPQAASGAGPLGGGDAATAFRPEGPAPCVRQGATRRDPLQGRRWALGPPFPPRPRGRGPSIARSPAPSCPAPFGDTVPVARGPCVQSFQVGGRERTWVFVHWDSGRERGSCGTEAVHLLPDRVIYTGTHHSCCCQDDPSLGDEFCRCTQNVSPGPPGLGRGAAAGSVSPGVGELPDPRSGGPLVC